MGAPVRSLLAIACLVALALAPRSASAATCTVSTTGLAFGPYDPFSTASVKSSGSLTLSCNQALLAYVTLGGGSSGDPGARWMTSGAARLGYNVYRDAALTRIWGDGNGYAGAWILLPSTVPLPFYGSIPAGQDVAVGTYGDAITVTVNFF